MTIQIRPHGLTSAEPAWVKEYEAILHAYSQAGGDPDRLRLHGAAVLVISANRLLAVNEVPGIHFEAEEQLQGVRAHITVDPDTHPDKPIHLCFGMLPAEGVQEIVADYTIGDRAVVKFIAHCTFPNATHLRHVMDAHIHVGSGASMTYTESHFHGPHGGIQVIPKLEVIVEEKGAFLNSFNLTHGRVGQLEIDYRVTVGKNGLAELTTKAYGWANDHLQVNETIRLNEESARGQAKTRIAVRDQAVSEVRTTAEGNAPFARGHMDCTEIVRGRATASNVPSVIVRDDRAHVTHEAAIGAVNRKELETLMARGLDEDEAADVIIRGMLEEG